MKSKNTNDGGIGYVTETDALWFINPVVSDVLTERIKNYSDPELEDAGL